MNAARRANLRSDWIPLADGAGVVQRQPAGSGTGPAAQTPGPDIPAQSPVESPLSQPQESPYGSPEEHPDSRPGEQDDQPQEVPPPPPGSVEQ